MDEETKRQLTIKLSEKINNHHSQLSDGITKAVESYIQQNPEKHKSAQMMGEDIMNKQYELQIGVDEDGDKINANKLRQACFYGLPEEELTLGEISLLEKYYGKGWRNFTQSDG